MDNSTVFNPLTPNTANRQEALSEHFALNYGYGGSRMYWITHNSLNLSLTDRQTECQVFWAHNEVWECWQGGISSPSFCSLSLDMHLALLELSAGMRAKTCPPLKMRRGIKNISLNMDLAQTNRSKDRALPFLMFAEHSWKLFFTVLFPLSNIVAILDIFFICLYHNSAVIHGRWWWYWW